jgi:hypothetical protein
MVPGVGKTPTVATDARDYRPPALRAKGPFVSRDDEHEKNTPHRDHQIPTHRHDKLTAERIIEMFKLKPRLIQTSLFLGLALLAV